MMVLSQQDNGRVGSLASPLKVAVIREEFVALTGDPLIAVVLNQLLYWTQRVKDFDLLLDEEKTFQPECNVGPRHGWIYKTASDLINETMLQVSPPTMRKYLKFLIDHAWVDERSNPQDKWDKTTQYRVNLRKVQEDLAMLGYTLWRLPTISSLCTGNPISSNVKNLQSKENLNDPISPNTPETAETPNLKNLHSNVENLASNERNFPSNVKNLASYTYTETTSEIKNREHTQEACAREDFSIFEEMLGLWKQHIGQGVHLTEIRKHQLESVLRTHFQNDIAKWEEFCLRIKASPFLMGEGVQRWRVALDWVLEEKNLLKVLEGNFDRPQDKDSAGGERARPDAELSALKESQNQRKAALLDSIEDPVWKEWCCALTKEPAQGSYALPSVFALEDLVKVCFKRFDGRLVYIECEDAYTLNRVEQFRFQLLSIIQRSFPKARNIRIDLKSNAESGHQDESLIQPQTFIPQRRHYHELNVSTYRALYSLFAHKSKRISRSSFDPYGFNALPA